MYAELPVEAKVQDDGCGRLVHWLSGCRQALGMGGSLFRLGGGGQVFVCLKSVPVAFAHKTKDLFGVVHSDDFVFVCLDPDLDFVLGVLEAAYELKTQRLVGMGIGGCQE